MDTLQYDSAQQPGPGNYTLKVKAGPTQHDLVEERHNASVCWKKNPSELAKTPAAKPQLPDAGTYKPVLLDTFAARENFPNKYPQRKVFPGSTQDAWGAAPRFELNHAPDKSKPKKENRAGVPGPGHYNVLNQWKSAKEQAKGRSLFNVVSTGLLKSVYY